MTTDRPLQLGMVGLGRMGANLSRRLMRDGHEVVVYDVNADAVKALEAEGATGATTLEDFVAALDPPRAAWIMVPAGEITESTVNSTAALMSEGDIIIDGGNSYYRDDIRRAGALRERGIHYVDVGTSGGVFGLERGYCLMIGGRGRGVQPPRPDLRDARAGRRGRRADARPRGRAHDGRARLPALRPERRRPLREDGAQRHRVRGHGGLRRGPQRPEERQRRHARTRERRRDRPARPPGVLPVRHRHPERRRGLAPRAASWAPGCST